MNQPLCRLLISVLIFSGFSGTPCLGRFAPDWPYEKLLAESDLVVVIEPLDNQPAKDEFSGDAYGRSKADFDATNTRFRIHAVFKPDGELPNELIVLHFTYSKRFQLDVDGADFIHFLIGPLQYEKRDLKDEKPVGGATVFKEKPLWLAFLKRRADGRFEPVTGQYDSAISFRELHHASFFVPNP